VPVRFRCPSCQQLLTIGTRKAGHVIPCPTCATAVTVPHPEAPGLDASESGWGDSPVPLIAPHAPPPQAAAPAPAPLQPTGPAGGRSNLGPMLLFLTAVVVVPPLAAVAIISIRPDVLGLPPAPAVVVAPSNPEGGPNPRARPQRPRALPPGLTDPFEPEPDTPAEDIPQRPPRKRPSEEEVVLPPLPPIPPPAEAPRPAPEPPRPVETPKQPKPPERSDPPSPERPAALPGAGGRLSARRRQTLDEEPLRKGLLDVPEVSLDHVPGSTAGVLQTVRLWNQNGGPVVDLMGHVARGRADLAGLRFFTGPDCQLGKEPAQTLQALSRKMRVELEACLPGGGDPRPDPDKLRARLLGGSGEWLRGEAVPAMLQLLQAENKPVRLVLVDMLGRIDHPDATRALALRAMVDLSAEVREAALECLRSRPPEDYRNLLLDGLQYPRREVRDHAAEALTALRCQEAVSALSDLLIVPGPDAPVRVQDGRTYRTVVRELVRVNHLGNCVLCHAPSFNLGDSVRGAVPIPGKPLPAPVTTPQYYEAPGAFFVRADVTYLRQDFSVMQTVANPGEWPSHQRYDYLVRLRTVSQQESQQRVQQHRELKAAGQRDAALFALRELTGQDFGNDVAAWQKYALRNHPPSEADLERSARRLGDELGRCVPEVREGFLQQIVAGKGAQYTDSLVYALGRIPQGERAKVRDALVERLTRMTKDTLRRKLEETDSELRQAAARACLKKEALEMVPDLIAVLRGEDDAAARAAHEALTGLTNQDFGPKPQATREARQDAADEWLNWWKDRKTR
jgi:HEAT repeat protein